MPSIIDLNISFFSPEFTLNPNHYLSDLYSQEDILGFHSEGMDFIFRHKQAREIMFNKNFIRGYASDDGQTQIEARYLEKYPNRTKQFLHNYNAGGRAPDIKFKTLIVRLIGDVAIQAHFDTVETVFTKLADGGRIDNYIDDISLVPLRVFMETAGIPYIEKDLPRLYWGGCAFVKGFENALQEETIAEADAGIKYLWTFVEDRYTSFAGNSLIGRFVREGKSIGLSEDNLTAAIAGIFIVSLANTIGISSSYMLRNLVNNPKARSQLLENPTLLNSDSTIMEFLRRDNHVKALSRHANESCNIDGLEIDKGRNINLFFPGINLDPNHWQNSLEIDFTRKFEGENNIVFGGSLFMCVGKKLGIIFIRHMLEGFLRYLPSTAEVIDNELEMDGSWVAERIIKNMPIQLT